MLRFLHDRMCRRWDSLNCAVRARASTTLSLLILAGAVPARTGSWCYGVACRHLETVQRASVRAAFLPYWDTVLCLMPFEPHGFSLHFCNPTLVKPPSVWVLHQNHLQITVRLQTGLSSLVVTHYLLYNEIRFFR